VNDGYVYCLICVGVTGDMFAPRDCINHECDWIICRDEHPVARHLEYVPESGSADWHVIVVGLHNAPRRSSGLLVSGVQVAASNRHINDSRAHAMVEYTECASVLDAAFLAESNCVDV